MVSIGNLSPITSDIQIDSAVIFYKKWSTPQTQDKRQIFENRCARRIYKEGLSRIWKYHQCHQKTVVKSQSKGWDTRNHNLYVSEDAKRIIQRHSVKSGIKKLATTGHSRKIVITDKFRRETVESYQTRIGYLYCFITPLTSKKWVQIVFIYQNSGIVI